jgi:seryl-tRNA synthetase
MPGTTVKTGKTMLDIQQLRSNLDAVAEGLAKRGKPIDFTEFTALETERKTLQTRTQELQAQRNSLSKQIGMLKGKGEDASDVMAQVGALGDELKASEARLGELLEKFNAILAALPNIPDESVPVGSDEAGNVEVKRWGTPRVFDFPVKDHTDVGEAIGQLDFATAAKISGSRFSLLKGGLARMHRALAQFMLDTHTAEHGYTEVYVPYLVNAASLHGTGQLPKFEEDLFKVLRGEQDPLYLIPTAEVPVTNIVRDEILAAESLPLEVRQPHPVFPFRSRFRRARRARHDPPASVRQGGIGADRASGKVGRSA